MATQAVHPAGPAAGHRPTRWWLEPAATIVALGGFSVFSIWEVLFHNTGQYGNYLAPFFSPSQDWGIRLLPAIWLVWIPLFFRFTCYYYRKEYFRGFMFDPPACAVSEPSGRGSAYTGETRFPFVINNLHRYFWYLVLFPVLVWLWYDTVRAFIFPSGFGVGLGSIIMLVDVIMLTLYSFSCHAWRHMVGGGLDCFSCGARPRFRYSLWQRVSHLNARHGLYAWVSMFTVWGTEVYIRLLIAGVLHDPRFI